MYDPGAKIDVSDEVVLNVDCASDRDLTYK